MSKCIQQYVGLNQIYKIWLNLVITPLHSKIPVVVEVETKAGVVVVVSSTAQSNMVGSAFVS